MRYVILCKRNPSGYWLIARDKVPYIFSNKEDANKIIEKKYSNYYNTIVYTIDEAIKYFQDCINDYRDEIKVLKGM